MDYWHTIKKDKGIIKKVSFALFGVITGFISAKIFFTTFKISDESMEPEFKKNKTSIVLKIFTPAAGDAVLVINPADKDTVLLKRIAAVEDDIIEIRSKIIYINEKKILPHKNFHSSDTRIFPVNFSQRDNMPAVKLKRNEYFLLSDNLDLSFDSREFGVINKNDIAGKIIYFFK